MLANSLGYGQNRDSCFMFVIYRRIARLEELNKIKKAGAHLR